MGRKIQSTRFNIGWLRIMIKVI